jgi:2-polyprenyl-6-methoxyphenol hydroxylase-like FAD-dependent oxidoreductase
VLGAGIAGLLVARVLTETFPRVTVVDRDDLDRDDLDRDDLDRDDLDRDDLSGPTDRRGAPQARHLHALMDRGRQIVEELHPGIVEDLTAAGAPTSEVLVGGRYYMHGQRLRSTPTTCCASARCACPG